MCTKSDIRYFSIGDNQTHHNYFSGLLYIPLFAPLLGSSAIRYGITLSVSRQSPRSSATMLGCEPRALQRTLAEGSERLLPCKLKIN